MIKVRNINVLGVAFGTVAAISVALAFGCLTPSPAHAEQWCHLIVGPVGPNGEAGEENEVCEGQPVVVPDKFAAIAVSDSTLSWGNSWAAPSQNEAEQVALSSCRKYATDCKVATWGEFRCLALAVSLPDKAWGADAGMYPETAEAKALKLCQTYGGKSCVVKTHPCSED